MGYTPTGGPILRRPPPPQPQGLPKQSKCDMCGASVKKWTCEYCGTRVSEKTNKGEN